MMRGRQWHCPLPELAKKSAMKKHPFPSKYFLRCINSFVYLEQNNSPEVPCRDEVVHVKSQVAVQTPVEEKKANVILSCIKA